MKTFEELGVSPEIRKAIEEMGYENPMPVQEEVIPYLLGENNDVVALAQTGTGKTAAFGLPLLQQIDVKNRIPQSLILCPTRELCLQIAGDLNDYDRCHLYLFSSALRLVGLSHYRRHLMPGLQDSFQRPHRKVRRSHKYDSHLHHASSVSSSTALLPNPLCR